MENKESPKLMQPGHVSGTRKQHSIAIQNHLCVLLTFSYRFSLVFLIGFGFKLPNKAGV